MIQLGEKQKLKVVKKVDFGVYLAEESQSETRVLLPARQVPQGTEPGDEIEVFIYKDSKDRIISTTQEPRLKLGEFAPLYCQFKKLELFWTGGWKKICFFHTKSRWEKYRSKMRSW